MAFRFDYEYDYRYEIRCLHTPPPPVITSSRHNLVAVAEWTMGFLKNLVASKTSIYILRNYDVSTD